MTQPVDAVVLEYYLGLLNGAIVADEIKQVRPHLPVVMVADPTELPDEALKSVDTLVDKSARPHFLWGGRAFPALHQGPARLSAGGSSNNTRTGSQR
jgi:hypothetical protein